MRKVAYSFVAGIVAAVVGACYAGPDAIVQAGLKLAAVQTQYVYDAQPVTVYDERQIFAELAKPVPAVQARRTGRK